MTTVLVNYNFGQFRTKVSPNTVLNDVLLESLRHYKLNGEEAFSSSQNWILLHNKKPVTLDLPWRFLNLSSGANLELKKADPISQTDEAASVKIKWLVTSHKTVIEVIKTSADLKDVLDVLSSKHGWSLEAAKTKLQVFSKAIPYEDLRGLTLKDLGVKDSAVVRVLIPARADAPQPGQVENKQDLVTEKPEAAEVEDSSTKRHELHKVSAFIPPDRSIAKQIQNEEQDAEDYEMTVDHARIYQHMLSKQTGGLGGPLMTKRLRMEKEAANKTSLLECVIRVRFPDLTYIEVAFDPSENMKSVYEVVSDSLVDNKLEFTLTQPHPLRACPPDDKRLAHDFGFGTKTLLVFNSKIKGPYLRNGLLESAKKLTEADDVKKDRTAHSDDGKRSEATKPSIGSSDRVLRKVPKWLKLSKK